MTTVFALLCGRLMDGHEVLYDKENLVVIIVKDNKIIQVGWENEVIIPEDAISINLSKATVMPGLIDCHVHPLIAEKDYQFAHIKMSSAYKALKGMNVVQKMLQCGWTSIRVAGDADVHYPMFDIRQAIRDKLFEGPRIFGAGHYLTITGGGGDINSIAHEHHGCFHPDGKVVDGVEDMRKAVREEIKYGSDWIKVLATGAFMSQGDDPKCVHFSEEELRMAVSEAARLGRPVMAHAHAAQGIKDALRAGVRSIEHGTFIDEEGIALLKEKNAFLVPTRFIGKYYAQNQTDNLTKMLDLHFKTDNESQQCVKKAVEAGVKIAVGSDYTGWDPCLNYNELVCLVKELGMSELQVLQAATSVGAELLGKSDSFGSIKPGLLADIIAVEGNPLNNIELMKDVTFVMLNGLPISSFSKNNK